MAITPSFRNGQDPLIQEIRAIRQAISERVGDDWDRLGEYLRRIGEEYRTRTGRLAGRPRGRKQAL